MSINFGTWLYEELTKMTEDHRKFFLAREDRRRRFQGPRCTGDSSDGLTLFALGLVQEPDKWNYPSDHSDLRACELTYKMAPADLQERMLPVLEKYRAHVTAKYPRPTLPEGADITGLDQTPSTTPEARS